jgi:peptide/nickel transport system permease protein
MIGERSGAAAVVPMIARPSVGRSQMTLTYWQRSGLRLLRNKTGLASSSFLLAMALLALFAPVISERILGYTPSQQDITDRFAGPSVAHWLGTDELGRDMLTRLLYGARISLGVAGLTVALAVAIGATVGSVAGYCGGWVDNVLMRLVDIFLAIPAIFLFILLAIMFRPDAVGLAVVLASVSWVTVARLCRAEILAMKHLDFVLAARAVGARPQRLILAHLLPGVVPILLVASTIQISNVILIEASLSFLGLGVQPPTASWGNMITVAREMLGRGANLALVPGLAIFLTVLAANLLGNALRDALDPTLT